MILRRWVIMVKFVAFFSTLQTSSARGWWNISHPELNRTYRRNFGMSFMQKTYGMTWTQMKRSMRALFRSDARDKRISDTIKRKVERFIPLRTGHLMDFIFKSMRIIRSSYYSSYFATLIFDYPKDRPTFIRNPKHGPPDTGYGEWGTVKLIEPIPIARVSVAHITGSGNALYNLIDPQAENHPIREIKKVGLKELKDDYATIANDVIITATI